MPLLAAFLGPLLRGIYKLYLGLQAQNWAMRIAIVAALATLYVACVATFTAMIIPWFGAILETGFGMLLGLLFPPASGTVVASLGMFWACVLAKRLTVRLMKAF